MTLPVPVVDFGVESGHGYEIDRGRVGGWASGRFGRAGAAGVAMVVSGACCLLSPLVFDDPWPVVALLLGLWGASVIADSGVFSTALSEVADLVGWRYAFLVLAPGPLLGAMAMRSYHRHVESRRERTA